MQRLHSYDEKNVDFSQIDFHAKRATLKDAASFETLIDYLSKPQTSTTKNPELLLVRGFVAWIAKALTDIDRDAPVNSPMGLVTMMATKAVSNTQLFKTFCDNANIDCQIVRGRRKAPIHRIGDGVSDIIQGYTWNIFTADGHQHLVDPWSLLMAKSGASYSGEIVLEADGRTRLERKREQKGSIVYRFDDSWFCMHPKIFVNRCFPNNPDHQLLPASDQVNSVDEFLDLPYLKRGFFESSLSLITEKSCRLTSTKGKCRIQLLHNRTNTSKPRGLNFSYELSIVASDITGIENMDLPRLVLFTRNTDTYEFEIRFPITGDFIFRLHIKTEYSKARCCEFRIKCTEIDKGCRKLPFESGIEGYGFGSSAEDAGLKNPSEPWGRVYMEPLSDGTGCKQKSIKFQAEEDHVRRTDYISELYSVDRDGNTTSHFGKSKTAVNPDTCNMSVEIDVGEPGEYALMIKSKERGRLYAREVAKYIVSTDEDVYENQKEIKLKKREVKKENKISAKEEVKRTLLGEHDALHREIGRLLRTQSD